MRVGLSTVANRAEMNVPAARKGPTPRRPITRGERRVTYALKILVVIALAIYLLVGMLQLLRRDPRRPGLLVVGALFLAYLSIRWCAGSTSSCRWCWSILIVYAIFALLLVVTFCGLVPPLDRSVAEAWCKQLPRLRRSSKHELANPTNPLLARIPVDRSRIYLANLPSQFGHAGADSTASTTLQKGVQVAALGRLARSRRSIIVPVLAAYMLHRCRATCAANSWAVSAQAPRQGRTAIIDDLDEVLGGFIRGQLIDGAIVGVMIFVMLTFMHVPYALLIGVAAGILNFIPYAGAVIGFVPSVILALAVQRADQRADRRAAVRRDPADRRQLRRAARAQGQRRALAALHHHRDPGRHRTLRAGRNVPGGAGCRDAARAARTFVAAAGPAHGGAAAVDAQAAARARGR